MASPNSLTYQGRVVKGNGTPLEFNSVSFQFEITSPDGLCILYREQINGIDMTNSSGVFDVPIGNGVQSYPNSGTFNLLDSFNNTTNFACDGGSSYLAAGGDYRKLRVKFHDGTGWKTISPDSTIRSVPYAAYSLSAQKLGNNVASDFVAKAGLPTCSIGTFLSWDGTNLSCTAVAGASGGTVTQVSSANSYLSITNGTSTPNLTLNVGTAVNTVAAGNDPRLVNAIQTNSAASGDLSGTYPGPTVVSLQGVGISSSTPTTGQFFKFNGTNWIPATLGTADVSGLSASLSNYLTQAAFNNSLASASCTASQSMYWNSVSSSFQCQNINTGLAGDVTGSLGASVVSKLQGSTLTISAPASGNYLRFNGTAFVNASLQASDLSGTLPAAGLPAFTGDVTSSAGSTVLTLSNSGASAGTYKSVTVDAKGRVTTGTNPTTLTGFGITDAVQNNGGSPGIQSGLDASKPGAPSAGAIYFATDTRQIYQFNSGSWVVIASASGTGVSTLAVTAPITNSGTATAPNISIPAATTGANGYLTSTDWNIFNNKLGTATAFSGDVSGAYNSTSVDKVKGTAVSATVPTAGQFLVYNGTTQYAPVSVSGDATMINTGALTIANSAVTNAKTANMAANTLKGNVTGGAATPTDVTITSLQGTTASTFAAGNDSRITGALQTSGGTLTGMLTLASGTTTLSPLRIPAGALVTTAVSGNIESDGASLYWTNSTPTRQKLAGYTGTPANGQLLIGNGTSFSLANITQGAGVTITNSAGGITIAASGSGGTVTSISSANADIGVATGTTTPVLTLNSGATGGAGDANKIAKLDAGGLLKTAMLPSIDTSKLNSGTLPIARGGTNSAAALLNNRIMASTGGAIVEASAITANRALISDANGIPTHSAVTNTELGYVSGVTSAIQTQINGKASSTGWTNYSAMGINGAGALTAIPGATSGSILNWTVTGPVWTTAAFPTSTTANQLLYSSANNVVGGLATANNSVLTTNGSGVPSWGAISSDAFAQYALLAGRAGGQTLYGGTAASNKLTLESTSHATKGDILLNPNGGAVGIGGANGPWTPLHVLGSASMGGTITAQRSSADNNGGEIQFVKSRGTAAAPTAVQSGDRLMGLYGVGYYSGAAVSANAGSIQITAAENFTSTAQGTVIDFGTTPVGSTTRGTRMTIDSTGNVGIGTASPGQKLTVAGTIESTSGGIRFPNATTQAESAFGPAFSVYSTATTASPTKVVFDIEEFDTDNAFNNATSKFQPPRAGYYEITAHVTRTCTGTGGGTLSMNISKNGVNIKQTVNLVNYASNFTHTLEINTLVYLNGSTDYLEVYISGNIPTDNLASGAHYTYMSGHFVRP